LIDWSGGERHKQYVAFLLNQLKNPFRAESLAIIVRLLPNTFLNCLFLASLPKERRE